MHLESIIRKLKNACYNAGFNYASMSIDTLKAFYNNNSWDHVDEQFLMAKNADIVIVVGGDGTKSHIINLMFESGRLQEFIGIAAGTMNVSLLNAFSIDDNIDFSFFKSRSVPCVLTIINGKKTLSMFDALFGTTCVATVDGLISQVSANKLLKGEKVFDNPTPIGNRKTEVKILKKSGNVIIFDKIVKIGTIGVSYLDRALSAKILAGGAETCACLGYIGGVIVAEFPLVWASVKPTDLEQWGTINSSFFPLEYGDTVTVKNLLLGSCFISDGNVIVEVDALNCEVSMMLIEKTFNVLVKDQR
jgi:hypothetical protein